MPEPVKHIEVTEQIQSSDQNQPISPVAPPPPPRRKRIHLTPAQRTWLAIAVICIMVVGAFFAPSEGDVDNVTGDPATVPTVVVTNLIESTQINHQLMYHGLRITIKDAQLARQFSDDKKHIGNYTLRIDIFVQNVSRKVIGVNYASQVRLLNTNGEALMTKFISIKPTAVAGSTQTGSFDFALAQPAPLSSLSLQLNNGIVIPLQ